MVTVLALLGVLAVLFAAAVLSTREQGLLADDSPADTHVDLPAEPLTPADVGRLRFSLAARGYRMSQVDEALERLAEELADRDRRIALLEAAAEGKQTPVREATPADLPVAPPPAPVASPAAPAPPEAPPVPPPAGPPAPDAPGEPRLGDQASPSAVPAAAGPTTWSSPAAVPEFPVISAPEQADPLPPADEHTDQQPPADEARQQ